ncbi:hypothetical protein PFISCL1PPCAC_991, partial [Pristionchus fissidentatus]
YQMQMEDADEDPEVSMMRSLAVRLCLWADENSSNCLEEVKKKVEYEPDIVDESMRMAVLYYAVNTMEKEKHLKEYFYKELKNDKRTQEELRKKIKQQILRQRPDDNNDK